MKIVIPARETSERVENKNYRPFYNQYSLVDIVQNLIPTLSFADDDVIVVHTERVPDFLLQSSATEYQFLSWLAEIEDWAKNTSILLLYPTTPLRTKETVDAVVRLFYDNRARNAVRTMRPVKEHPNKMWRPDGEGLVYPLCGDNPSDPVQFGDVCYIQTPVAYIGTVSMVETNKGLWSRPTIPYLVDEIEGLDINTEEDFKTAQKLYKERMEK